MLQHGCACRRQASSSCLTTVSTQAFLQPSASATFGRGTVCWWWWASQSGAQPSRRSPKIQRAGTIVLGAPKGARTGKPGAGTNITSQSTRRHQYESARTSRHPCRECEKQWLSRRLMAASRWLKASRNQQMAAYSEPPPPEWEQVVTVGQRQRGQGLISGPSGSFPGG